MPRANTATFRCGACKTLCPTRPGLMVSNSQLPSSPVARRPKPTQPGCTIFGCRSSGWLYLPLASACQISIIASLSGVPSPSNTRQVSQTRSPCICGPAMRLMQCSSVVGSKWKNGPTVCDGVGTRSISALKRCGFGTAQHDVELIACGPLRLRGFQIELRNHALPGSFVRHRLVDRVVGEHRVAREIHLRHQARD